MSWWAWFAWWCTFVDFRYGYCCIVGFCYFWCDFCRPNLKKFSSWNLFPTSSSITYFNLGIFENYLIPFVGPSLDRNGSARFTVHPTFGSVRIFINFSRPIFKILPSQKLLGTYLAITYKNFKVFQNDLGTEWVVFWWPEGLS